MPALLLLPLLPLLWAAALAYYVVSFRRQALLPPVAGPANYDLVVQAAARDEITLRALDPKHPPTDLAHPGTLGLEWEDGYTQVGDVVRSGDHFVARRCPAGSQRPPLGTRVRLDSYAFAHDPMSRGIPFGEVTVAGPLGDCPAWKVEGSGPTWAVLVHGKGADRREFLRMLPAIRAAGLPALVITYRNDMGAPAAPDGRYGYGASEWPDLEAAVEYAIANGAERVVLGGFSMGGAICMAFLRNSKLGDRIVGLVLDAPMLDFAATVAHGSGTSKMRRLVARPGPWLVARLLGIDWDALDYLSDARATVRIPTLLFHGTADGRVPIQTSDRLAAMFPDLVRYERTQGIDHVRSWNANPEEYERTVEAFLRDLAPPGAS